MSLVIENNATDISYCKMLERNMIDNRIDIYKEIYHKEVERRSELNNDLSLPIAIISIIATGVIYYALTFNFSLNLYLSIIFTALLIVSATFLLVSIFYLARAYLLLTNNNGYTYMAYANEIEKYYLGCRQAYIDIANDIITAEKKAEEKLKDYLVEVYIRASTRNMSLNDERSNNLFRCKRNLLITTIFLILTFIPFFINFLYKEKELALIEIPNKVQITIDSTYFKSIKIATIMAEDTTPKPVEKPTQPILPNPPADRNVKEGERPTKPVIKEGGR